MSTRMIDRNGHRFGAAVSAAVLLIAFLFRWDAAVAAMAAALLVGPVFGLRYSPLGATYRFIKRTFKLDIPVEPEEEAPPRFAQVIGFIFLGVASLAFYAWEIDALAWTLALIVAGLQGLLAGSGICVGCEVYNFGRRLRTRSVVS